ncbi:MAG: DNA repair protein RecO [Candidatus Staskawiczbacteria bacterium]|jgi:DNA repair protein RecO (recombination protein O)
MTVHYRTRGFVIKKNNIAEADRVYIIFTKDFGRIKVSGKAIRKINSKLRGGIDILSLSEIEFIQGKNHKTLTDAVFLERFENIREDLIRTKIAYKVVSVLDDLIKDEDEDERIWDLVTDTFNKINDLSLSSPRCLLVYYYFLWNLFSILGYKPELSNCVICQKKLSSINLYFSSNEGGAVCHFCGGKETGKYQSARPESLKMLRLILEKNWQTLSRLRNPKLSQNFLEGISENYCCHLLSSQSPR